LSSQACILRGRGEAAATIVAVVQELSPIPGFTLPLWTDCQKMRCGARADLHDSTVVICFERLAATASAGVMRDGLAS
jgi:hypothetical protein